MKRRPSRVLLPSSFLREAQTGDVLAFSGTGLFSRAIQLKTKSPISHVGIITSSRGTLCCVEATDRGVVESPLPSSLYGYDGHIYWLRLSKEARRDASPGHMLSFASSFIGRPYDWEQVFKAGVDLMEWAGFKPTLNREDLAKLFCSELVASILETGFVISGVNASEMTPADIVNLPIFDGCVPLTSGAPRLRREGHNGTEDGP